MADEINISDATAGLTDASSVLNSLTDVLSRLDTTLGVFGKGLESLTGKFPKLNNVIGDVSVVASDTFKKMNNYISGTSEMTDDAVDHMGSLAVSVITASGNFEKFDGSKTIMSGLAKSTAEATTGLETLGTYGSQLDDILSFPKGLAGNTFLGKMVAKLQDVSDAFKRIAASAQGAAQAETDMLRLDAAAGVLGGDFLATEDRIKHLDQEMIKFTSNMVDSANQVGIGADKVVAYAAKVKEVPGALEEMVHLSESAGLAQNFLTAAMIASRGMLKDTSEVIGFHNERWAEFKTTGEASLQVMSLMHLTAQQMKIPFEFISGAVKGISSEFKLFGDSAEGATKLMTGFGNALIQQNVGAKTASEIVKNLGTSIANLDIAQKGFLSSQTGGAGGIQGAFQVQLKLQEGKLDEVANDMFTALKDKFGSIVTTKEAAESPEAAGQLLKQIQFLKAGPFGALAKTDQEAIKVLEALNSGNSISQMVASKQEALDNTTRVGVSLQERQTTILTAIQNTIFKWSQAAGVVNYNNVRGVVGNENETVSKMITNSLEDATKNLTSKGGKLTDEERQQKPTSALMEEVKTAAGVIGRNIPEGFSSIMKSVDGLINSSTEIAIDKSKKTTNDIHNRMMADARSQSAERQAELVTQSQAMSKNNKKTIVEESTENQNIASKNQIHEVRIFVNDEERVKMIAQGEILRLDNGVNP